jgi:putative transposase
LLAIAHCFAAVPCAQANLSPHASSRHHTSQPLNKAVIELAVCMRNTGARKIADAFNRIHAPRASVGKSFVAELLRKHRYDVMHQQRQMKHNVPRPLAKNECWGLDATGKTLVHGVLMNIVGIVDHGARLAVCLQAVHRLAFKAAALALLSAIASYGKPKAIRTDNGSVFVSKRFRKLLRLLGIKHERIQPGCPWMNGRIERFFGTLKEKLNKLHVADSQSLQTLLADFRFWYNDVRTHQHLQGRTPREVWRSVASCVPAQRIRFYSAWGGLLTGFHLQR